MIQLNKGDFPEYRNLYRCPCCEALCITYGDTKCSNCHEVIEWIGEELLFGLTIDEFVAIAKQYIRGKFEKRKGKIQEEIKING
jgi:hypothetical protein